MTEVRIGSETAADRDGIRLIHLAAFPGANEADLVDRLRADGDLVLSLVARAGETVGHVAFSRVALPERSIKVSALAPLAVLPSRQRAGIGSALVRQGLAFLRAAREDLVLVLGEPAFYGRFGFSAEAARPLSTPYDGPFLQALALSAAGRQAAGAVRYAGAFADLA
jgi:putative acetyltransferase